MFVAFNWSTFWQGLTSSAFVFVIDLICGNAT